MASKILNFKIYFVLNILVLAGGLASPDWKYDPRRAGSALYDGGWTLHYPIAGIEGSLEFSFPLQLVYLTTRAQKGLFGSQWFCPQLESSLVPKESGVLTWTMPSGVEMPFRADPKRGNGFVSFDGNWRISVTSGRNEIFNAEGWRFVYGKGKLEKVFSPTGRILEFVRNDGILQALQLLDPETKATLTLAVMDYHDNRRLKSLKIRDRVSKFTFTQDGPDDRLSLWSRPVGPDLHFSYLPYAGVLMQCAIGDEKAAGKIIRYETAFSTPYVKRKPSQEQNAKGNPKNYWLTADDKFVYSYGRDPVIKDLWKSEQITLDSRTGYRQEVRFANVANAETVLQDGNERRITYWKAPGQRYHGKPRRIEENGKLLAEYIYSRKTGLLAESLDSAGRITSFEYQSGEGNLRRELWEPKPIRIRTGTREKMDVVCEINYDDLGRVILSKDVLGNSVSYEYNARGEIVGTAGPGDWKSRFEYDGLGRCTAVLQGGVTQRFEYDNLGRLKSQTLGDGVLLEYVFNQRGQLAQIKRNGNPATDYVYDDLGRARNEADALGRIKTLEWDEWGNLLAEVSPGGQVTRYEYDEFGRKAAQIDGNGNRIDFAYDPYGRLKEQIDALGNKQEWEYDSKGRLLKKKNGEQSASYSYDNRGRLSQIDYGSNQVVNYKYDSDDRIANAVAGERKLEYVYDAIGRVEAIKFVYGDQAHVLRYRYNGSGQRSGVMLARLDSGPSNGTDANTPAKYHILQQTEYEHDGSGRLSRILRNGRTVVQYAYDARGRLEAKTFGNGMTASMGYDPGSRLAKVTFSGGALGAPLVLEYEWDAANQIVRRRWNGTSRFYEYDRNARLAKVRGETPEEIIEKYSYDSAGNLTEKIVNGETVQMKYNSGNQLTESSTLFASPSVGTKVGPGESKEVASESADRKEVMTFSYDKAGRMLGGSGGKGCTYGWDDRLVEVSNPNGGRIIYEYWPDGQIAEKRALGVNGDSSSGTAEDAGAHKFFWDGLSLLSQGDTMYVIEPHLNGGVPLASCKDGADGGLEFYLNDIIGTTLAVVDERRVQQMELTSYGAPIRQADPDPKVAPGH